MFSKKLTVLVFFSLGLILTPYIKFPSNQSKKVMALHLNQAQSQNTQPPHTTTQDTVDQAKDTKKSITASFAKTFCALPEVTLCIHNVSIAECIDKASKYFEYCSEKYAPLAEQIVREKGYSELVAKIAECAGSSFGDEFGDESSNNCIAGLKDINPEFKTYSTKGHPKAKGLNISIKYPATWVAEEAVHPNIVQNFSTINENIGTGCSIMIRDFPKELSAASDLELADAAFSEDYIRTFFFGEGEGKIIRWSKTKYDGQPGAKVVFATTLEKAGLKTQILALAHNLIYSKKYVAVQCGVSGLDSISREKIEEIFNKQTPLYTNIGLSIVVHDKWQKFTSKEKIEPVAIKEKDWPSKSNGEYGLVTFLLSLILTLAIGLLPPYIIRYKVIKKPLSKEWAIGIAGLLWLIDIIFFVAIGSLNKPSIGLVLISIASYYILRAKKSYPKE